MKRTAFLALSSLVFVFLAGASPVVAGGRLTPVYLRCEQMVNPPGIDATSPHLSWYSQSADSTVRGETQTAYEILVASSLSKLDNNVGNLWDSEKILSDQSINVIYKGRKLKSGMQCYWKVRVWDSLGKPSDWSKPAMWSMGLLQPKDWQGYWIGLDSVVTRGRFDPKYVRVTHQMRRIFYTYNHFKEVNADTAFTHLPARMLRKEFDVKKKVKRATMYICGLGLFKLYVNGEKIGKQVMSPALSWYPDRSYYMTFNVTKDLQQGRNAIGVILGNGRFFATRTVATRTFGYPKMICQLNIEYTDGSKQSVVSDSTWKITTSGPIRTNNEYDGEVFDARLEMPGWNKPGFNASDWMNAKRVADPSKSLRAEMQYPIKVMQTVKPKSLTEVAPGVYVFDMGQNMVGWASLRVKAPRGTAITMRFGETLETGGFVDFRSARDAMQTDVYIGKGEGWVNWQPSFTYHGFRYVEVKGFPGKPTLNTIEGKVVYDGIRTIGSFASSNDTINKIYNAAYWTIRGNYRSIPTDCPQRDERQGWLGDHAVNSYGESFIFDNDRIYQQWMIDIKDGQKPDGALPAIAPTYWVSYNNSVTWPSAFILASDNMYRQFGNTEIIRDNYAAMKLWMSYMQKSYMKSYLMPGDRYGDWDQPPRDNADIKEHNPKVIPDKDFISSAYYYHCLKLMAHNADMLGKKSDASSYMSLAEKVRAAINRTFLSPDSTYYAKNTLTGNTLALAFGIPPTVCRNKVVANYAGEFVHTDDSHTTCGLIGQNWIMRAFTDNGRPDLAYKLATNMTYPSFGYMIRHGATTIWELWDGNTVAKPHSFNHVMQLGDFVVWLYQDLAGIETDPSAPAFKHIIMEPTPVGDLNYVNASYLSMYGPIRSDWHLDGNRFTWKIVVPPNTSATVYVPAREGADVTEGGLLASMANGVKFVKMTNGRAEYQIGSGVYQFESTSCYKQSLLGHRKNEWVAGY